MQALNSDKIKIVKLFGNPGSGKCSVAIEAMQYLFDRQYFTDGAVTLTLDTHEPLLKQAIKAIDTNLNDMQELINKLQNKNMIIVVKKNEQAYNK